MSNLSKQLQSYRNQNIHIVGIGSAEGSAIAEFLVINGISSITGHDFSEEGEFKKTFNNTHLSLKPKEREKALGHLLNLPIKINFKDRYLEGIEEADMVFVSQVWFKYPQNLPILEKLKDSGVPFKTITNLYFELAPCKIISVTGTNGKTTTARLINSIFELWVATPQPPKSLTPQPPLSGGLQNNPPDKGGRGVKERFKIYFAGNDRQNIQVLDKFSEMTKEDVLILETSSTQLLLNSGISPYIGVITNITPNHIDDHGSFENYIEAKKNLIRFQRKEDWAVLNYDDAYSQKSIKSLKSKVFLFSRREELEEGCFVRDGVAVARKDKKETILFSTDDVKLPGKHNLENALAAASAAYVFGINPEIIKEGISKYTGLKHRLKLLYNINGVRYYDDTQATTPEATIAGLESFSENLILLAGGDNKGMNYKKLAEKIKEKVKLLILFPGNASDEIEKLISNHLSLSLSKEGIGSCCSRSSLSKERIGSYGEGGFDFKKVKNIGEAMETLKNYYKKNAITKGNMVVLISPAAAHFYSRFVENTKKNLKEWIREIATSC